MKQNHVLAIIYLSIFLAVGLVVYSIKLAPIFTGVLLLALGLIVLFMLYETMLIHSAAEFENRFWTGITLVLAISLFFAVDSPLVTLTKNNIPVEVSWLFIIMITFAATMQLFKDFIFKFYIFIQSFHLLFHIVLIYIFNFHFI